MRELRSGLVSRQDFVQRVDQLQRPAGYRLVQIVLPGWAALGMPRPYPEPWAHVAVPPPPDLPEVGL